MTDAIQMDQTGVPLYDSVFTLKPRGKVDDQSGRRMVFIAYCNGAAHSLQIQYHQEGPADSFVSTSDSGEPSLPPEGAPSYIRAYFDQVTEPDTNLDMGLRDELTNEDAAVIEGRLADLLYETRDEHFEDGIDSRFALGLNKMVKQYGQVALGVIGGYWSLLAKMYVEEFCETLIQLGRLEHEPTKDARRELLEKALAHRDPSVRDAAVIGLDSFGDPQSIAALSRARLVEEVPSIKTMLDSVLKYSSFPLE